MTEIIFHHYPVSPVAEKVRAGLGIKKLAWRSVEHNRLPDRPELFAMTAGYRRIPVMQIGADIYCDSQCILRELERRFPEPTFFPGPRQGHAVGHLALDRRAGVRADVPHRVRARDGQACRRRWSPTARGSIWAPART